MYEFKQDDAERFARHVGISARRKGHNLQFKKCPYCNQNTDDTNTFAIDLNTGTFNCFRASCGAKGNMLTLSKDFDFPIDFGNNDYYYEKKKQYRQLPNVKPETKPSAIKYLLHRNISMKVAQDYNITIHKKYENVLVFPFYDENNVLQFVKYRKTDFDKTKDKNKEWCEPDCKPILFGMNHCNSENKTLIITEGQLDSLSLIEAGIENAVSVPTGAKGFTWVPHCWEFLKKFETLIVFGDYEKGHITLLDELTQRFEGIVKHIRPEDYLDCKDANEILQKHGRETLVKAVEQSVVVEHPQIKPLINIKRVDMGKLEKFSTGLPTLDSMIGGFFFGQLILLTGERGEGKSTLASQFGTFAIKAGYNAFFYSGELVNWYFKAWFDAQVAGLSHMNKKVSNSGFVTYSVDASVERNMDEWYREKAYVFDSGILAERNQPLLEVIKTSIRQYGCRFIVVDNLMSAMVDVVSSDPYQQQTVFVNELAKIAKQFNVVVLLIAHPRKKQVESFDNDDVAGSSNITNLVDVVMRFSKPKGKDIPPDTEQRVLTVLKNRLTGKTDRKGIDLYYQQGSRRISEKEDFNWTLGWEPKIEQQGFMAVSEDSMLPWMQEGT